MRRQRSCHFAFTATAKYTPVHPLPFAFSFCGARCTLALCVFCALHRPADRHSFLPIQFLSQRSALTLHTSVPVFCRLCNTQYRLSLVALSHRVLVALHSRCTPLAPSSTSSASFPLLGRSVVLHCSFPLPSRLAHLPLSLGCSFPVRAYSVLVLSRPVSLPALALHIGSSSSTPPLLLLFSSSSRSSRSLLYLLPSLHRCSVQQLNPSVPPVFLLPLFLLLYLSYNPHLPSSSSVGAHLPRLDIAIDSSTSTRHPRHIDIDTDTDDTTDNIDSRQHRLRPGISESLVFNEHTSHLVFFAIYVYLNVDIEQL